MAVLSSLVAALALSGIIPGVLGHGDHSPEAIRAELALRDYVTNSARRSLAQCAGSPAALALKERAVSRRAAAAKLLREKRGLQKTPLRRRDQAALEKWAASSHDLSSSLDYTLNTPESTIFASNASCSLVPEVTIGPYYVEGELIRTDITDGQAGVPVHLDIQFVDVTTCEAVPSLLIDIWHCNSTGVYSGVAAQGQGGLNSTHGRGVQESDADGVVQFDTLFPGHYTGRAPHIHMMSTAGATTLPNGTFEGGSARHIGQIFFDQDLIGAVEATVPYSTNQQPLTQNIDDDIAAGESTDAYDPFPQYVMLGDNLSDGLLMWTTIAIDTTADYDVSAAAHYYEGGGVANENSGAPGGGPPGGSGGPGGPGGNGTRPGTSATGGAGGSSGGSSTSISTVTATAGAAKRYQPGLRFFGQ